MEMGRKCDGLAGSPALWTGYTNECFQDEGKSLVVIRKRRRCPMELKASFRMRIRKPSAGYRSSAPRAGEFRMLKMMRCKALWLIVCRMNEHASTLGRQAGRGWVAEVAERKRLQYVAQRRLPGKKNSFILFGEVVGSTGHWSACYELTCVSASNSYYFPVLQCELSALLPSVKSKSRPGESIFRTVLVWPVTPPHGTGLTRDPTRGGPAHVA